MVAIRTAVLAADRITALVLVSTTPKFIASADWPYGIPEVILKRLRQRIKREGTRAFHELVFKNGEHIGVKHLPIEEAEQELAELSKVDLRADLAKITIPTLIIHGDKDEICLPGAAEYMKCSIFNAQLSMMVGVGHAPMVEKPELFNKTLEEFVNKYAG